jgi:hypothetical protein
MRRLILIAAAVLALLPTQALADGKFYSPRSPAEEVPPHIPYQRAVIVHDGARELLILQSKFEGRAQDFGWVVPLPAVPELTSISSPQQLKKFDFLVRSLELMSSPDFVSISGWLVVGLVVLFAVSSVAILCLVAVGAWRKLRGKSPAQSLSRALGVFSVMWIISIVSAFIMELLGGASFVTSIGSENAWVFVVLLLSSPAALFCSQFVSLSVKAFPVLARSAMYLAILWVLYIAAKPNYLGSSSSGGVEVVKEDVVGIYDVKVIKAQESADIIAWLNEHGYKFDETDKNAFDDYIKRGWCFVTARIDMKKSEGTALADNQGLVNPLVAVFESKEVVYPLALTGTAGKETEVLLYVFGRHKMVDPTGRFALRYATFGNLKMPYGYIHHPVIYPGWLFVGTGINDYLHFPATVHYPWYLLQHPEKPKSLYDCLDFDRPEVRDKLDFGPDPWPYCFQDYLVKLKGRLKPEDMKEDLILHPAPDNNLYRERVLVW